VVPTSKYTLVGKTIVLKEMGGGKKKNRSSVLYSRTSVQGRGYNWKNTRGGSRNYKEVQGKLAVQQEGPSVQFEHMWLYGQHIRRIMQRGRHVEGEKGWRVAFTESRSRFDC